MKIIHGHLGLGDHIATVGIVIHFALQEDIVVVPVWKHNYNTIKSFYVNFKNVKLLTYSGQDAIFNVDECLGLGHYNILPQRDHEDFVQWFYRVANVPILEKKLHNHHFIKAAESVKQLEIGKQDFILIHDDTEREFRITHKEPIKYSSIFYPKLNKSTPNESILQYSEALKHAKEIHCIDSSFLHLAECLETTGELFYHKYARPNSTDYKYLTKNWKVLE